MSRLGAAVGAGLGGVAGAAGGYYANRAARARRLGYSVAPREAELYGAVFGAIVGGAIGAGSSEKPAGTVGELTPAQAAGVPDFVTDVPVQGPTDPTMRAADCKFVRDRIPAQKQCVDCEGTIPMWTRQNLSLGGRALYSGAVGERLAFGGIGRPGFALAAIGDPDVFVGLTAAQKQWVVDTLVKLNDLIVKSTGTTCPSFGPSVTAAGGCFQGWFNSSNFGFTKANGDQLSLRTDGVFDQDTLDALRTVAALDPANFPTPFPGTTLPGQTGTGEKKKLSTGAMVGIAAGGAAVVAGIAYLATRKSKKSRRRR